MILNNVEVTIEENKSLKLSSNRYNLNTIIIGLFLFFLPFSQALTFNVFFPIKLSEIFILIYAITNVKKVIEIKLYKHWIFILLFIVIVFFSMAINTFVKYDYNLDISNVRINKYVDSFLKYLYLIIAFAAMWSTNNAISKKPKVIKYLFWGTHVAAIYCWYLFFSSLLHIPYLVLPGMDYPPQTAITSFGEIIRSGTAKEGNFMGFFLLISGISALHFNYKKDAVFYFLTILTTFSTIGIVTCLLYVFLILIHNRRMNFVKKYTIIISLFSLITVLFLFSIDVRSIIYNKIFGTEGTVEDANSVYSKYDRLNESLVGAEIFINNPFFGVGVANYGIHFQHYNSLQNFDNSPVKRIPNNIYIELLSETGIISTLMFLFFLYYLFKLCKKHNVIYLKYGLLVSLIYFSAFPTYTMLFIWVFFGLITSVQKNNYNNLPIIN